MEKGNLAIESNEEEPEVWGKRGENSLLSRVFRNRPWIYRLMIYFKTSALGETVRE